MSTFWVQAKLKGGGGRGTPTHILSSYVLGDFVDITQRPVKSILAGIASRTSPKALNILNISKGLLKAFP